VAIVAMMALPGCGPGLCGGDGPGALNGLTLAERWLRVSGMGPVSNSDGAVLGMRVAGTLHLQMEVAPVDASHAVGTPRQRTIQVHSSFLPGIAEELASHRDVFLAMASKGLEEEQVAYVIVRAADGSHHFPGECGSDVEASLRQQLGDRYDATIDAVIGTTGRHRILALLSLPGTG